MGVPKKRIAEQLGFDVKTVRRYLAVARTRSVDPAHGLARARRRHGRRPPARHPRPPRHPARTAGRPGLAARPLPAAREPVRPPARTSRAVERRRKHVTPDVISAELKTVLRRLKLSRMLDTLPERLALARQQKMPVLRQSPVRVETIDDSAQGHDPRRLDASPPRGPPALRSALRSRRDLVVENLALRQQLVTLTRRRRPDIRPADRLFWILLRRLWSGWAEVLTIVRPDTVVGCHRAGFRIYWNWLSRRGKRSGRPPLPLEVRALIRRMAFENSWGEPRIHGELLCLGFEVSERSVSRHVRPLPRAPRAHPTWTTFLRNHRDGIAAMDFFSVPTAMFRVPSCVPHHGRHDIVRCTVTTSPTAAGVARQLREAFPFDSAPRFMIFDRDAIFAAEVTATLRSMQMKPARTSYRSPWQNRVAERFPRNGPPGVGRPRHRPERAPSTPTPRFVHRLLPSTERTSQQGLPARASGGAPPGSGFHRRQLPSGRWPASPLRLAQGGVADPPGCAAALPIASCDRTIGFCPALCSGVHSEGSRPRFRLALPYRRSV